MSDLIKLDNISKRNGDIRACPIPGNLKSTHTGKDGWGEVTIAIDNATVSRLNNDDLFGILCLVSREEWEKEKAEEGDSD